MIPITLDKERNLLLSLGAIRRFKEKTGKDLMVEADRKEMAENPSIDNLCVLVWACLYHEDKSLTVEDVSDMIHVGNMNYVAEQINKAWTS